SVPISSTATGISVSSVRASRSKKSPRIAARAAGTNPSEARRRSHPRGAWMRVAVIGASGLVGGHTLRFLRAAGDRVRAVIRTPGKLTADADRRIADVCDVYALRDAIAGCDYVVHAALGPPNVILGSLAPVYAAAEAMG